MDEINTLIAGVTAATIRESQKESVLNSLQDISVQEFTAAQTEKVLAAIDTLSNTPLNTKQVDSSVGTLSQIFHRGRTPNLRRRQPWRRMFPEVTMR